MQASLTIRGLEVDAAHMVSCLGKEGAAKLLKKLTIRYPAPIGNYHISKKLYVESRKDGKIILPRFSKEILLKTKFIQSVENKITPGESANIEFIGKPTHNQQIVGDWFIKNTPGGHTIKMQAGSGKTFLAMYVMSKLKKKTLIITPQTFLLNQWKENIQQFCPGVTIGEYYGKKKSDGDVVIAIINSIIGPTITIDGAEIDTKEYMSSFGLVVLDESHTYATDSFSKLYNHIQREYILALSATPDERKYGLDKVSHYWVGHMVDAEKLQGYHIQNTQFTAKIHVVKYHGPPELTVTRINEKTGMPFVPAMISDLISDECRNDLIIEWIKKLMIDKHYLFVFSERREHAKVLASMLGEYDCVDEDTYIVMYGGSSKEDIHTAKTTSSVVFTTYGYSSTGVSIDHMTAMILATPRRSKATQIVGRVFRQNQKFEHIEREIVDIVDANSMLAGQLRDRMVTYRDRNGIIRYYVSHHPDILSNKD